MEMELKCLKRIYVNNGFKIQPDPEAPVRTDDLCDCLSGAIGVSMESIYTGYPKTGTVYLPQSIGTGQQEWKVGSGVYPGNMWNNMYRKFGKPIGQSGI